VQLYCNAGATGVAVIDVEYELVAVSEVVVVFVAVSVVIKTGVATTGVVIVGATVITDSPLQSAAAIALSVEALIASADPTIVVDKASARIRSAT
jgi:hypothetical protein